MAHPAIAAQINGQTRSELIEPIRALSSCLLLGLVRDTRGVGLSDEDRHNHFFTSPYCTITCFIEGESQMVSPSWNNGAGLPRINVQGPNTVPLVSYNPGPLYVLGFAFRNDAFYALTGISPETIKDQMLDGEKILSGNLVDLIENSLLNNALDEAGRLSTFQAGLEQLWAQRRASNFGRFGDRVSDWANYMVGQLAKSSSAKSARQFQRKIKKMSGLSQRDLNQFARQENIFERTISLRAGEQTDLSQIALESGFSDQSHMGREVRRITGKSPRQINQLIQTKESYWCYRLMESYYG